MALIRHDDIGLLAQDRLAVPAAARDAFGAFDKSAGASTIVMVVEDGWLHFRPSGSAFGRIAEAFARVDRISSRLDADDPVWDALIKLGGRTGEQQIDAAGRFVLSPQMLRFLLKGVDRTEPLRLIARPGAMDLMTISLWDRLDSGDDGLTERRKAGLDRIRGWLDRAMLGQPADEALGADGRAPPAGRQFGESLPAAGEAGVVPMMRRLHNAPGDGS